MGSLIAEYRQSSGLTQAALARLVGVKQQSVSKWEAGTSKPAPEIMGKVETILGMDPGQLLIAAGWHFHLQGREEGSPDLVLVNPAAGFNPDEDTWMGGSVIELAGASWRMLRRFDALDEADQKIIVETVNAFFDRRIRAELANEQFAQAAQGGATESQEGTVDKLPATSGFDPDEP